MISDHGKYQRTATRASIGGRLPLPLALALALAHGCTAPAQDEADDQSLEVAATRGLLMDGELVEVLDTGEEIRERFVRNDRTFVWRQKARFGDAKAPEEPSLRESGDLEQLSVEELAERMRAVILYQGHEFVDSEPPYEAAELAKKYDARQRQGASPDELAAILAPSQSEIGALVRDRDDEDRTDQPQRKGILGGNDDRTVMGNTSYPHSTQIAFDNTSVNSGINGAEGSGTMIGPSTAMSVAHVFWDETNDTWEPYARWAPGYDSQDADPSPFGDWFACYAVIIPTAYTVSEDAANDYAVIDFNRAGYKCGSVSNGVNSDRPGNSTGWIGTWAASESDIESRSIYVRGYPAPGTCGSAGGACNVRVWGHVASQPDATSNLVLHRSDTSVGQSGSAAYLYADPSCTSCGYGPYLVGHHRATYNATYNSARRYTSEVLAFMRFYSSDW